MNAVTPDHLARLYSATDDPWKFATSPYEQARFDAVAAALARPRYGSVLEVGCGNGALARRIAPRAGAYTGVDAVERALASARVAVPEGRFHRQMLPAELPDGDYDLILMSEILYFLDRPGLADLAEQIDRRWGGAELVCVNWLGDSGNPLQGPEALAAFDAALTRPLACLRPGPDFRIDRRLP
ncbi:methyltransferase, putative [Oceanicola granulosus HTCC2516]|uniref:Methyltransferase, putative n=1 Tax=Oceanicola granulosus (strain ATCC BAA-861 / DSM 15982 / KCTC 12143 / HTCC2516) TaxID=314256 RepID=Q2CC91_OCEGH|nr:SAM-dependent methyltransferase [Oceanicola granulosus]EAR50269.1 methyltransferase, putative [Oceanicola granulosus HTCC2516]